MSGVAIRRKEGESATSLIYRFSKKVQQSGILREVKSRRFLRRKANKTKVKASALHRLARAKELERKRKLGLL